MNERHTSSHELVGAYALHALDDPERASFERHLDTCSRCTTELIELRQATAAMAAAQSTEPPAHLREDVLQQIGDTPQEGLRLRHRARPRAPTARRPVPVRELIGRHVPQLALAAAALIAVVVLGVNVLPSPASPIDEIRTAAEAGDTAAVDRLLEEFEDELVVNDATTDAGVDARLVRGDDGTVLITDGLPELPADRVYQAWLIDGDGAHPGGLLGRGADPVGELGVIEGGTQAVAVSVEPAGGSQQPSDDVVVAIPTA